MLIQSHAPGSLGTRAITCMCMPIGKEKVRVIMLVTKVHHSSTNYDSCFKLNFITDISLDK